MRIRGGWVLPVIAVSLSAGCGGCFDRFAQEDELMRYEAVESPEFARQCHGVQLGATTAQPFERVDVELKVYDFSEEGPQRVEDLFAMQIRFGAEEEVGAVQMVHFDGEAETHYFHAPPHSAGLGGGDVYLQFTDGELECDHVESLTIGAIGLAPGALEETLEVAAQVSRSLLDFYGHDVEELLALPEEEVPLLLAPLVEQVWTVNHPENQNSLMLAIQERRGPFGESETAIQEAEAYMAASGMKESLERSLVALEDLKVEHADFQLTFRQTAPLINGLVIDQQHQALCGMIPNLLGEVEIQTGRELSAVMLAAQTARGMERDVGVTNAWVTLMSSRTGPIGTILGLVLTGDTISRMAHSRLLPTQLYGAWADFGPDFYEDEKEMKEWENFHISAASLGWDATQTILEALMSAGNNLAPGALGTPGTAFDFLSAGETILDVDGLNVLREHAVYKWMYEHFGNQTDCELTTGPWEDISIGMTSPTFYEISHRFAIGHRQRQSGFCAPNETLTIPINKYEPRSVGTGILRVNLSHEAFPPETNRYTSRFEENVTVRPINVVFQESNLVGAPGSTVELTAEIRNAVYRLGTWSVEPASAEIVSSTRDGNVHRATIRLPDDSDEFPVFVTLESDSNSGLRHPACDPPPRRSTAVIRFDESIDISPKIQCIARGDSLQFETRVFSPDPNPEIQWETSGGSISSSGLFEGTDDGEFLISATLPESGRTAAATIRVGTCECFYHLSLSGAVEGEIGEFANIVSEFLGEELFLMRFGDDRTGNHSRFFVPDVVGLEGMPFSSRAAGTVQWKQIVNSNFPDMEVWFDVEDTVIIVDHWSERDYIQGRIRGSAIGGLTTEFVDGQERLLPATFPTVFLELEFMGPLFNPLRNPLGMFSHNCPVAGLDLGSAWE